MNNSTDDSLEKEIEKSKQGAMPNKDLWPEIETAINSSYFTSNKAMVFAASVVLAIGIAFASGLYLGDAQGDTPNFEELLALLQADHEKRKQALLKEYQYQEALAPDWELQMVQMEQAEQAIFDALNQDPSNQELLKILRQVQTQQISLITSIYTPFFIGDYYEN